jgi:hypothetical protein
MISAPAIDPKRKTSDKLVTIAVPGDGEPSKFDMTKSMSSIVLRTRNKCNAGRQSHRMSRKISRVEESIPSMGYIYT